MKKIGKLALLLAVIATLMTFALSEINIVTKPLILQQQFEKTQSALRQVMPEAAEGVILTFTDAKGKPDYYMGYSNADTTGFVGMAFEASKPGYSGDVRSIVGVDSSWAIKGVVITKHTETPGLGAKCTDNQPFDGKKYSLAQFVGKGLKDMKVDKDGGEIVSITGATITVRTIANSIKEKMSDLQSRIGEAK